MWRNTKVHVYRYGKYDPSSHAADLPVAIDASNPTKLHAIQQAFPVDQQYTLLLNVERSRVPELLFQPSMCGLDQAGIGELMNSVVAQYSPSIRAQMGQNIFITGGHTQYPGFKARIEGYAKAMLPFGTPFACHAASHASWDAFRGGCQLAQSTAPIWMTRAQWLEMGGDGYFTEHAASNKRYNPPTTL